MGDTRGIYNFAGLRKLHILRRFIFCGFQSSGRYKWDGGNRNRAGCEKFKNLRIFVDRKTKRSSFRVDLLADRELSYFTGQILDENKDITILLRNEKSSIKSTKQRTIYCSKM